MEKNCCITDDFRWDLAGLIFSVDDLNDALDGLKTLIEVETNEWDEQRMWLQKAIEHANIILNCSESLIKSIECLDEENC